jgi:hypothetical protein
MKIEITGSRAGDFREVGFFNFEDEAVVSYTGLLTRNEAAALSDQLREVAHDLALWAQGEGRDDGQILLPIFANAIAA